MARIKVTPEQVRQVAAQFRKQGEMSQQMVSSLNAAIKGMETEWEGMTKEKFFSDFQQWHGSMNHFVQLLQGISQQLESIASRFEAADRTA